MRRIVLSVDGRQRQMCISGRLLMPLQLRRFGSLLSSLPCDQYGLEMCLIWFLCFLFLAYGLEMPVMSCLVYLAYGLEMCLTWF